MPLPDERPRQSVANLIGRFEKQKSSSGAAAPSPPTFPRTSSVISHRTGDSAQEEVKEKREWPPKSVETPATSLSPPVPGPGKRLTPPSLTPPAQKEPSLPPEPVLQSPPVETKPSPPPAVDPRQSMPTTAKSPPPSQKPSNARATSSVKSPTPKAPVKSSSATPLKPAAPGGSTSATPLKPQHTGQSVASTGPAARTAAKRMSATPKPPAAATPTRVKTPLSTARPKTPSSTARPKTPSGLYAPTAASLARSRAGAPAPPPSEKPKRKITTDLSKPTAASASRMRSPAATPARGGKAPAGKPTATRPVAKPAIGKATPAKKPPVAKPATGHAKDAKKIASTVGHATKADVPETITVDPVEAVVAKHDEQTPEDAPSSTALTIDDTTETDPEDAIHDHDMHEDAEEDDHHDVEEPHDSVGEDIENYDDDFPDESHLDVYEVHEDHENGDIEKAEAAGGISNEALLVDEPDHQHETEAEHTLQDSNDTHLVPEEAPDHPEDTGESFLQSPSKSLDVSADLHHSEDIVQSEPYELEVLEASEVTKAIPTAAGTDLEDIVNLLESGPKVQRPSVEASSGASTVSETGEIPDEY